MAASATRLLSAEALDVRKTSYRFGTESIDGARVMHTDDESRLSIWMFVDQSDHRLELVQHMLGEHSAEPNRGFVGAAAVILHSAIDEWVTGNLISDTRQYCARYRKSFERSWREWDVFGSTLHSKIDRLARVNSGEQWRISRRSPDVSALDGLNQHRNRLVHMDPALLRFQITGDPPPAPPKEPQLYEFMRLDSPVVITHEDGSESTIEQTQVLLDPWTRLDPRVIERALAAFLAMREQYWGTWGEDVGDLEFPDGPIWSRTSPRRLA